MRIPDLSSFIECFHLFPTQYSTCFLTCYIHVCAHINSHTHRHEFPPPNNAIVSYYFTLNFLNSFTLKCIGFHQILFCVYCNYTVFVLCNVSMMNEWHYYWFEAIMNTTWLWWIRLCVCKFDSLTLCWGFGYQ